MKTFRSLLVLVALLGVSTPSSAAVIVWETVLTSAQENPPNASTAIGEGRVRFNEDTNVLRLDLTWSGLTSTATQSHIHCCTTPNLNTGIALDLWLAANPRPVAGSYKATYDLDVTNPFRTAFVTANGGTALSAFATLRSAMDVGNAYFNIHTTSFPGGEIRGNLTRSQVPEPGLLLLVGLGMAASRLRRRT